VYITCYCFDILVPIKMRDHFFKGSSPSKIRYEGAQILDLLGYLMNSRIDVNRYIPISFLTYMAIKFKNTMFCSNPKVRKEYDTYKREIERRSDYRSMGFVNFDGVINQDLMILLQTRNPKIINIISCLLNIMIKSRMTYIFIYNYYTVHGRQMTLKPFMTLAYNKIFNDFMDRNGISQITLS